MANKLAILLKETGEIEVINVPTENKGLQFYYQNINCDLITIVNAMYLGKKYSLVADDEGLLKAEPKVNMLASILYGYLQHGQYLVGNVLVMKDEFTDEGLDTVGLDKAEAAVIVNILNDLKKKYKIIN